MSSRALYEALKFNPMLAIDWNIEFLAKYYNDSLTEAIEVN